MGQVASYFGGTGTVNEVGAWHTPFQTHPAVPGRIVVAKKSLHYSDDGGDSWTSWSGTGEVRSTALALSSSDPELALLAKNNALYARQGAAGFLQVEGLPDLHIGDVFYARDNSIHEWWVAFAGYEAGTKVWRTLDGGTTWNNVSAGLPNLPIHCLLEHSDGTWMCGSDLGVHTWSEESQSWTLYGAGLPLTPVTDLEEDPTLNRILAATYGRGVWASQWSSAPQWAVAPLSLDALPVQCENIISGRLLLQNAGQVSVTECVLEVTLTQGPNEFTLWENVILSQPLQPGMSIATPDLLISSPFLGKVEVSIQIHALDGTPTGAPWASHVWASGMTKRRCSPGGATVKTRTCCDLMAQDENGELALASTPPRPGTPWPLGARRVLHLDLERRGWRWLLRRLLSRGRWVPPASRLRRAVSHVRRPRFWGHLQCDILLWCVHVPCRLQRRWNPKCGRLSGVIGRLWVHKRLLADNSNDGVVNVIDVMNFPHIASIVLPTGYGLETYFRAMGTQSSTQWSSLKR